jgi:phage/plasmid-associated DNA primase
LVVGEINTVNFPINRLADRFNIGQLRSARININREATGSKLANIDIFKSIVSNERINGEHKFGQPFSFKCHCKLIFAGNTLPQLTETDGNNEAMFNRLCVLTFKNGLNDGQKDLQLLKKLYEERDIIFSSAVDMLKDLAENRFVFEQDDDSTDYLNAYREEQQALPNFIAERCEVSPDNRIHTKEIIAEFKQYCKENSLTNCYSDRNISLYIADLQGVTRKKLRINNSNPLYGYEGIGLKL